MRKRQNGLSYRAPAHAMTCRCTLCRHYDARQGQPDPAVAALVSTPAAPALQQTEPAPAPAQDIAAAEPASTSAKARGSQAAAAE